MSQRSTRMSNFLRIVSMIYLPSALGTMASVLMVHLSPSSVLICPSQCVPVPVSFGPHRDDRHLENAGADDAVKEVAADAPPAAAAAEGEVKEEEEVKKEGEEGEGEKAEEAKEPKEEEPKVCRGRGGW